MKKNLIYKVFLILFAVLYVSTAFISFLHAIEFFSIGNVHWMSIVLSAVFEVGQMTVLMSLLMTKNSRKALPWFLMGIFTSVQVVSNVYSVTKYIMLSEVEYYKYLEQALKFLIQGVPQDMILTVIAWIIGGLLPICALLLTAMCASQMQIMEENNTEGTPEPEANAEPAAETESNPVNEESVEEPKSTQAPKSVPYDFSDLIASEQKPEKETVVSKIKEKLKMPAVKPKRNTPPQNQTEPTNGPHVATAGYFEKPDRP